MRAGYNCSNLVLSGEDDGSWIMGLKNLNGINREVVLFTLVSTAAYPFLS